MKKILLTGLLFAISSMALATEPNSRPQATASNTGPEIQVTQDELKKAVEGEEELNRLATFGKMHFFGYGEMHYNNPIGSDEDEIDFHRLVLGFGYDFTEKIQFRAELDFEHAFTEPELEYAYVDFLWKEFINFRAGAILVPMGVINQHHEPPLFYSVERPELYRVIIPSSWQEAGVGIHGRFENGLNYELYLMSSLTAVTLDGGALDRSFTGSSGARGARNGVAEADARSFAGAGRLQYKGIPGLRLGTSAFIGNTGQGNDDIGGALFTMIEGDAKYSIEGIDIEGLVAFTNLGNSEEINNILLANASTDFAGQQMFGWYLEVAYHLFHHLLPNTKHDLVLFTRFEDYNTQFKMPTGFAADPTNNRNTWTTGVSYMPIPNVAIKADYMANWNEQDGGTDQFNLGIGFYY